AKNLSAVKAKSHSSKRPLPLGEGWGQGLASTANYPHTLFLFSLRFAPSPWPSPRGRGNKRLAYDYFLAHGSRTNGLTTQVGPYYIRNTADRISPKSNMKKTAQTG